MSGTVPFLIDEQSPAVPCRDAERLGICCPPSRSFDADTSVPCCDNVVQHTVGSMI